ncbi:hypothetical protein Leryth_013023 [Lithospermum erythrorhizon]|nr:hypothetical protein Leryth_013023 [Lithospermum erythrorhizon]
MGSCLSKKGVNAKTPSIVLSQTEVINATPQVEKKRVQEEPLKKEIFVIKHRKSHEIERRKEQENVDVVVVVKKDDEVVESVKNGKMGYNGVQVRTSSCTKEEVDAILIQCGRLSRSSSTGKAGLSGSGENSNGGSSKGKRYCGSKRSFDFDSENGGEGGKGGEGSEEVEDDGVGVERGNRHRNRHRSRTPGSPGKGRRRTPSREREQGQQQQARSGSRERGVNGSGRRVSRSPGRRSESPNSSLNGAGNSSGNGNGSRPQKMVSVPATVTSLAMDKSTNGDGGEGVSAAAIKRIQVKRNVGGGGDVAVGGGARAAASPRARSPARIAQNQQPISLSRSNSRKNEQSPFRRNPLSDIDTNVVLEKMPVPGLKTSSNNVMSQALTQKLNGDSETKLSTNVTVVVTESLKPEGVGRTRSSRLSRDLDINPEDPTNANPSYTSLLLEDIQNFHQKNTGPVPAVKLPACVSKAHSILEALEDLNSGTSSNLSSALSGNRRRSPLEDNPTGMRKFETKESFGKSQVVVPNDELMQPSFHKYVTVRRGTLEGSELEEQESSGSNSFVAGSQQQWVSSSSWEPTSADSTDRWTSRSNKEDEFNPLGFQRQAISNTGREVGDARRRVVVKRKDGDLQQNGIGRGRVGPRGPYTTPTAATASN